MVRRFYYRSVDGMGDKVTGARIKGDWIINHVSRTMRTATGFWDVPGQYVGIVRKRHNKWYAEHDRAGGYEMECKTLTAAVEYLMRRDAIV
jgi:hypothetical protein